ncbi:MAG: glycosyltransferase family 39 protein [Solirubrobacterales bacterium]|nr:glycosyltransferase family 39 protein [Solirubrobacterales bacterium]
MVPELASTGPEMASNGRKPERSWFTRRRELAILGMVLAAGVVLLGRHITSWSTDFDEQVYLASGDLLRHGFKLGNQVFASQPPLFYSLLRGAEIVTGGSATLLRVVTVILTLAGATAAWAIVRSRAGRPAALAAAALVIAAPGVINGAGVVSADIPSVTLGTLALLATQRACRLPRWAPLAGALLAAAVMIKLLAVPFVPAIIALAWMRRPPRSSIVAFGAGFLAVVAILGIAYLGVLGPLWQGVIGLHMTARNVKIGFYSNAPTFQAVALVVLGYLGLFAILAAGLADWQRGGVRAWVSARLDLLVLLIDGIAFCALQRPVQAHQLVIIGWPLAMLAATCVPRRIERGPAIALAAVGVALLTPMAVAGRPVESKSQRSSLLSAAALVAAHTKPNDQIVSDLPEVTLLAGRVPAPMTVDPSYVRIESGQLSAALIRKAALQADAVVVGRSFKLVPGITPMLSRLFRRHDSVDGVTVWTAPRHAASSPTRPPRHSAHAAGS